MVAAGEGERAALGELVRRWAPRVTAICHARLGSADRDAVDELTQESLVRGVAGLGRLSHPAKFGSWLRGIAIRVCMDWLRTTRPGSQSGELGDKDVPDDLFADSPSDIVEREDERGQLIAAVEGLPCGYREVVMLFYYQDLSYAEIGATLGVSPATVNARLAKARAALRDKLSRTGSGQ